MLIAEAKAMLAEAKAMLAGLKGIMISPIVIVIGPTLAAAVAGVEDATDLFKDRIADGHPCGDGRH